VSPDVAPGDAAPGDATPGDGIPGGERARGRRARDGRVGDASTGDIVPPDYRGAYAELLDEVSATLFLHDPLELHLDEHAGEYRPLAAAVLARLRTVNNRWDAAGEIHAACVASAGPRRAGRPERYRDLGGDVWDVWARYVK
jgi:hypothetical protein